MKFVLPLILALAFACVSGQTSADVDKILASADSASAAMKCVVTFTPGCSPVLEKLSKTAPAIIKDGGECGTCTPEEKVLLKQLVDGLKSKYPEVFKATVSTIKANNGIKT